MWISFEKDSVFVCPWFGFVAVYYEISRPDIFGEESPFDSGWKSGSASAEKRGFFDFLMHLFWCKTQSSLQRLIAS
jgi:hypothetical protein